MSNFFNIVLFTSMDNRTMKQLMGKLGQADRIFQLVYVGQTEEVLPCYVSEIDSEKILRIGDLNDFDWELESDYGIESEMLLDEQRTKEFIEHVNQYMQKHSAMPVVGDLWAEIQEKRSAGLAGAAELVKQ